MRLSNEPPYSSWRWLLRGERNSCSRYPWAAWISITSKPAAIERFGCDKGLDDGLNLFLAQRLGRIVIRSKGNRAGSHSLPSALGDWDLPATFPWPVGTGFAPGMGQLDSGNGSLGCDEFRDGGEHGDVLVPPDAEVFGADAANRLDGGGFGEDQGRASDRPAA